MKGKRTLLFAFLGFIVSVAEILKEEALVPDDWMPWVLLAFAVGTALLRWITTTPVGRAE